VPTLQPVPPPLHVRKRLALGSSTTSLWTVGMHVWRRRRRRGVCLCTGAPGTLDSEHLRWHPGCCSALLHGGAQDIWFRLRSL